jgi:hypothetical protein
MLFLIFAGGTITAQVRNVANYTIASNGDTLNFLEYRPGGHDNPGNTRKYPLIIFLHGIGEKSNISSNVWRVQNQGLPKVIADGNLMAFTWNNKTDTFIVLSPMCRNTFRGTNTSIGIWPDVYIHAMLSYANSNLRIDTNKIYLTGLSFGGGGTLNFLSIAAPNAKKLAAVAPVCPPYHFFVMQRPAGPSYVVNANLPFWGFHAEDDLVAIPGATVSAVTNINNLNPPVRAISTIWPTGGHAIWDRVYKDALNKGGYDGVINIYEWFLAQDKSLPPNILPVARAGNDLTIHVNSAGATLNASNSSDADGSIVRYVWKKVSAPAGVNLSGIVITNDFGPNAHITPVSNLTTVGAYKFLLHVVDNRGGVAKDTVVIHVVNTTPNPSLDPIAIAGNDTTVTLPADSVRLRETSYDPDGGQIIYRKWEYLSGPAYYAFSNQFVYSPLIYNLRQGTYQFRLTVKDDEGVYDYDTIQITVNPNPTNLPPVARAGDDVTITLPTDSVRLYETSSDPDGTIAGRLWTYIDGPSSYTFDNIYIYKPLIYNLVAGTYHFRLQVRDNNNVYNWDTIAINVLPANIPPVANAGNDVTITLPTDSVRLLETSTDADGTIALRKWEYMDGPSSYTISNEFLYTPLISDLNEGTYRFQLIVRDNYGAYDYDTISITVLPDPVTNIPPVANAGNDVTLTLPADSVKLLETSTDADGFIALRKWVYIDGPSTYTISNPFVYSPMLSDLLEGTYRFLLKVKDDDGAYGYDTISITVNPAPNVPPVANAGTNVTITLPVDSVRLNETSTDADGEIAYRKWEYISGPSTYSFSNDMAQSVLIYHLQQGNYLFKLTVKDEDDVAAYDTVAITVLPNVIVNIPPVARAGNDVTISLPKDSVNLYETSYDPDGTIAGRYWTYISGPLSYTFSNPYLYKPVLYNLQAGTYKFRLQIRDNNNAYSWDTIMITVLSNPSGNMPPKARAGNDVTITLPTDSIRLTETSYDPDGTISLRKWDYIDGPSSYAFSNQFMYTCLMYNLVEGTYHFRLIVRDNDHIPTYDTIAITVNPVAGGRMASPAGQTLTEEDVIVTYPNPAHDIVNLRLSDKLAGKMSIQIYDAKGVLRKSDYLQKTNTVLQRSINVSDLEGGIYYIRVLVNGTTYSVKIVKQ